MGDHSKRLLFIDALRGVAALAVVLTHLSEHVASGGSKILGAVLSICSYGYIGVPIFFVLSGFVISSVVTCESHSLTWLGRFALRRSLRLDPPYWIAIVFALVMLSVKDNILHLPVTYPSFENIALHFFYLQNYFSVSPQLSAVFWTLCLEIQFYLFFVASVYLMAKFKFTNFLNAHTVFLVVSGLLSIFIFVGIVDVKIPGLFLNFWYFFVLGALVQRAVMGGNSLRFYLGLASISGALCFTLIASKSFILAALICSSTIYLSGVNGFLVNGFNYRWLQFLGTISYSLYLTHAEFGWKFISVLNKFQLFGPSAAQQFVLLIVAVLFSVFMAYLFYVAFEKPSLWLSKKITVKN